MRKIIKTPFYKKSDLAALDVIQVFHLTNGAKKIGLPTKPWKDGMC